VAIERIIASRTDGAVSTKLSQSLDELIERRAAFLTAYQDAAYARKYQAVVEKVRSAESGAARGLTGLTEAVARYCFKLMAYKDEYEVARLFTQTGFDERVKAQFEGPYKLHFHLAPPLLGRRNERGEAVKSEFGPWMLSAFKLLAKLRRLRGTALDVFGYTEERRAERRLIEEYTQVLDELAAGLRPENHAVAVQIASIPEEIRGYGHVKMRSLVAAKEKQARLLAEFRNPAQQRAAA